MRKLKLITVSAPAAYKDIAEFLIASSSSGVLKPSLIFLDTKHGYSMFSWVTDFQD